MKTNHLYLVGIGAQGVALHHYLVEASNQYEAWQKAHRAYLSPEKGFDYISVKRVKKGSVKLS